MKKSPFFDESVGTREIAFLGETAAFFFKNFGGMLDFLRSYGYNDFR